MCDLQFYPTPPVLAYKAFTKFKNKSFVRILEPSAGRGDLLAGFITGNHSRTDLIDAIEIDLDNQAILRSKGLNVIDADFLQFDGAALYSHVILNPPFSQGAEHVVKAFSLLASGELVAIVNAETVRNPFSSLRKLLAKFIEDHGSVEFMDQTFTDPDTLRKTNIEIALIHLEKKVDLRHSFTQNLDTDKPQGIYDDSKQELAIKNSTISNVISIFNAAVSALRASELAIEGSIYYTSLLGRPLNQMTTDDKEITPDDLQRRFNKGYDDLKNRAWNNVLNSTEFDKYLSSKAYTKLVADFSQVSKLSFTESNIRGFLLGLVNGQADMNMQMLLDCFDDITKYIPENRAYYRGWKSNLKHKEQAFRVQMTRFIMPRITCYYSRSPSASVTWESMKKLQDFDKVFAMLDGKAECETSLHWLFTHKFKELCEGRRLPSTYFDVRFYPGVGTIHFFPTNKAIIDRFNRLVGKERQWLPQDDAQASKAFWKQYDSAEKVTRKMIMPKFRFCNEIIDEQLIDAHLVACENLGFDMTNMLSSDEGAAA
jgi:hypothetical protein